MPEYSSTTITPADGVQVPSMNGSTSGNFLLSALKSYILAEKGQANGLASLGSDGKLPAAQLPDLADDVIVVASYAVLPAAGTAGKLYITADNNKMYRWDPDLTTPDYVELSVDLSAYATKAELAEEESAREAADSNLKSAITANSKRITNLETKAGDEIPVTYPSATYGMDGVPASVAPYGKVRELIMNSRVRNNHIQGGDFTDGGTLDSAMGTVTYNSNGITSVLPSNTYYEQAFTKIFADTIKAGRVILIGLVGDNIPKRLYNGSTNVLSVASSNFDVVTLTGDVDRLKFGPYSLSETTTYNWKYCILRDLNQYFSTTDLSFLGATDSAKLATIQRDYPELLIPSDYDTGTRVDTTYSEVKTTSINIWDEITTSGKGISWSTGQILDASGRSISTNFQPVLPSTQYYGKGQVGVVFYDIGKNFISSNSNVYDSSFTTPANCYYIMLVIFSDSYTGGIQICLDSASEKTIYHPHDLDSLILPSPVTGKSAGSVHQIYYPETGEMTEPLGEYTITGNESFLATGGNQYIISGWGQAQGAKLVSPVTVANLFCTFAIPDSYSNANVNGQVGKIALDDRGYLLVTTDIHSKWSNLVGEKIYFELATPNPNSQATDPVLDPFVKVEGNGTIRPVQSQTTQIDSAMSVDYLGV